jgi:hypothetical protein
MEGEVIAVNYKCPQCGHVEHIEITWASKQAFCTIEMCNKCQYKFIVQYNEENVRDVSNK